MRRSLLILTVLLFMPAIGFSQTTWYVPDDFSTIQGAISDTSVVNGDTVIVRAGIYVENIDFLGKAITLQSELGVDVTFIDGNQVGSVVICQSGEGSNSVLDGFTLTNGAHSGMLTDNYSSPTVMNCTFSGNSAYHGGGMNNYDHCNPIVTDCTFIGNSSTTAGGGGMINYRSSNPTVSNCIFTGNSTTTAGGGGMLNQDSSSPTVMNCTFSGNTAYYEGGGMNNYDGSSPTVINCTFTGNSAGYGGGGMFNYNSSNPTVTNCIFWNDTFDEIFNHTSSPTVTYSCVQGGYAGTGNIDADPLFADPGTNDFHLTLLSPCIDVGDNDAPELPLTDFEGDPRIFDGNFDKIDIVDMGCDELCFPYIIVPDDLLTIQAAIKVSMNTGTIMVRAGTYMENIDFLGKVITLKSEQGPDVTIIDGNRAGSVVTCQSGENEFSVIDGFTITNGYALSGGGMHNYSSSPTVTNCTFTGNVATTNGGGMDNYYSSPTVTNCTFIENWAVNRAGGMYNYSSSSPTLTNCTFTDNSADYGGGMLNDSSSPTVINCTFTENRANVNGGGMYNYSSSNPTVTNCIFWNDTPSEIYNSSGSPTVTYSCVQGGYAGTGNIDADPLFLDPWNDDYHLSYASLCIDAGHNNAPSLPAMDFEGDPRIFHGNGTGISPVGSLHHRVFVDMGADEYCLLKQKKFIPK